ncbi:MAG: DinB family protein [Planctomycetia bacterium]|nr:DinB family protein [Planctomycetia bacterium]
MNARDAIKININMANMICQSYLGDLTDADLLVRPVPGANHIAWQLGHLLVAEHGMVDAAVPGTMPPLPVGFAEKYSNDASKLDSASAFHPKSVYMSVYEQMRAGMLKALDKITDADLDKPAPEKFRSFLGTLGDLFSMQGSHWIMHAGQWAVIRRKLGKKPLF